MGKLILSLDGATLAEYEMDKERHTIGRLPDNDIHIDNMAVSGHHALIINILNDSFLEDLNSTNGTYVNGKVIKKHALANGDVITLGRHELRYEAEGDGDGEDEEADFEKTMVIRPSSKTAAKPPPEAAPEAAPEGKPAGLPRGKLQVMSGSAKGKEMELTKALTTLGRPGVQVAAITRRSDGFFIVPVESGEGMGPPTVNDQPIGQQAHKLSNNDVIELANIKMGFYNIDD